MKFLMGISVFFIIIFILLIILLALIMPENYDKHISEVMALIGSLTALISVMWTQYNKSLEERNKLSMFKLEKSHQISQEVYQELFKNKLFIYKNLYDELIKYKKRLTEIGKEDYDMDSNGEVIYSEITKEDINILTLKSIFSIVEKNIFVISLEIEDILSNLMISYQSKENEFDWLFQNGISTEHEAIDTNKKLDKKFFIEHQKQISKLFNQIESEIKQMKKEIGFI